MKINTLFTSPMPYLLFVLALMALSCSGDDDIVEVLLKPEVELSQKEQNLQTVVGDTLAFSAKIINGAPFKEEWKLGDSIVSSTATYSFVPKASGNYQLKYRAFNDTGDFIQDYTIEVEKKIRPTTEESSAYVTELLEYLPAPGQFINKNPGNMASAEGILGTKNGLVSLGAWGGSITLGFDHTVLNKENAKDLIIYANALSVGAEPGVVWVMLDENANGLADDIWYEIKGSAHDMEGTLREYSVTYFKPETKEDDVPWEDSEGNKGFVPINSYHKPPYYPQSIQEDSYTITGTLLTDANIDRSNPSFITSNSFDYGYADNTTGGDEIDLADAIDEDGNPVTLPGIDFIKIQTGIQANMSWLGELSTEVSGVADLNL